MTRRTYRLPAHLDQALAQHAKAQGTTPSVVIRDALSAWLLMEGTRLRLTVELQDIRRDLRTCLDLLQGLIRHEAIAPPAVAAVPVSDRVRARFDQLNQLNNEEDRRANGNR